MPTIPKTKGKLNVLYQMWGKEPGKFWTYLNGKRVEFNNLVGAREAAGRNGYSGIRIVPEGEGGK